MRASVLFRGIGIVLLAVSIYPIGVFSLSWGAWAFALGCFFMLRAEISDLRMKLKEEISEMRRVVEEIKRNEDNE